MGFLFLGNMGALLQVLNLLNKRALKDAEGNLRTILLELASSVSAFLRDSFLSSLLAGPVGLTHKAGTAAHLCNLTS